MRETQQIIEETNETKGKSGRTPVSSSINASQRVGLFDKVVIDAEVETDVIFD